MPVGFVGLDGRLAVCALGVTCIGCATGIGAVRVSDGSTGLCGWSYAAYILNRGIRADPGQWGSAGLDRGDAGTQLTKQRSRRYGESHLASGVDAAYWHVAQLANH